MHYYHRTAPNEEVIVDKCRLHQCDNIAIYSDLSKIPFRFRLIYKPEPSTRQRRNWERCLS